MLPLYINTNPSGMSTNKNALIRYKVLDSCFRNVGKRYFIEDLINECENVLLDIDSNSNGISRRQIFDDIAFMESSEGWSIELNRERLGKRIFYRYCDPSFSINNMPLNNVEINHLKSAINILTQFKGMPQFEWVNELLPKLQQGISSQNNQEEIIEFDSNQYLKGIEFLGELYNSILNKKVLLIDYKPYNVEVPYQLELHPSYLKQYNNRWFVFGYYPDKEKFDWNLALDRIVSIKEIRHKYISNSAFNWVDYFDDIIGVTKPIKSNVETVILRFKSNTAQYIITKPIHGSQKSKWINDDQLEVSIEVILNYELERLILSYADTVEVVKPISLKKTIINRLRKALEIYQ